MYRQHRRLLLSSPSNPLRVYTACCGVDLTLAGLRAEGLPYSIVGASEIDPDCRRIFAQCEPELPPSHFYSTPGALLLPRIPLIAMPSSSRPRANRSPMPIST